MSPSNRPESEPIAQRLPRPEQLPKQEAAIEKGEPPVESFTNRGERILAEGAAKVTAALAGLRSRLSSFADRLRGVAATGVGATAVGLETGATIVSKTLEAPIEGVRGIPTIARSMAESLRNEAAEVGTGFHDLVRPREAANMEAVAEVELRMQRLQDMMSEFDPGPDRDVLVAKYEELAAERTKLLDTQRYTLGTKAAAEAAAALQSGGKKALTVGAAVAMAPVLGATAVGVGMYKGGERVVSAAADAGRWAAEKVGEMQDAHAQERAALMAEQENARIARAELFLDDAAQMSGTEMPKLSREALIAMGKGLEDSLAKRLGQGVKDVARGMLLVDDITEIGQNLKAGAIDFAKFVRNPEAQAELISAMRTLNVEAGAALEDAFTTVAKAGGHAAVRGGKAALTAAGTVAAAPFIAGAGLAVAGIEAAANSTPAREARKVVIAKWEAHRPAVEQGFARTVDGLDRLGKNMANLPRDVQRELNTLAVEVNENAEQVLGLFDRMKKFVDNAVNIARRKLNEFLLEVAQEGAAADQNPELVAKIDNAANQVDQIDQMRAGRPANRTPETRPVIRQTRGNSR